MASKFTIHNGLESNDVNSPINVTTGLQVGGISVQSISGTARYVDAASTAGDGDGQSRGTAFPTLQAAIDVAQEHDVIFVFPGSYDENLLVTTDYLTIVGVQTGYGRPDVVPATGVALTVRAQGFNAVRCRFVSTDGDCVLLEGNGFLFDDCVFDEDGTATAGIRFKGNATDDSLTASEGVVSNCLFRGPAAGCIFDTAEPAVGVGSTDNKIVGCKFVDCTQDLVTADTGPGTYSVQRLVVDRCTFADKNKVNYVDFTTSNGGAASDQTGTIVDCYFATDSITTTNVAVVGTGFTVVGCYDTVGVQDGSGLD